MSLSPPLLYFRGVSVLPSVYAAFLEIWILLSVVADGSNYPILCCSLPYFSSLFSSELSVGSSLRWLLTDDASHLLVRRNDGGRWYFYRQWTLRIRQFVVRVLLEVVVEGHLERKQAGSELHVAIMCYSSK